MHIDDIGQRNWTIITQICSDGSQNKQNAKINDSFRWFLITLVKDAYGFEKGISLLLLRLETTDTKEMGWCLKKVRSKMFILEAVRFEKQDWTYEKQQL